MPNPKAQSAGPVTAAITFLPANAGTCEDIQVVFGAKGYAKKCQCQRFRMAGRAWDRAWTTGSVEERAKQLRQQTKCGHPGAPTTSGLIAYLNGEPVGWCSVGPRTAYVRLQRKPLVWAAREEAKADDSVWAVTCFVTRAGFRRRGVSRALARAAADFARERGARAVEGYPMIPEPDKDVPWGELHVGSRSIFAGAGFAEVSRPTLRRVVMRIDF